MIQADTFDEMDAMLEKARAKRDKLNPTVTLVEFGEYIVTGSSGKEYVIQAGETEFGEIWIACYCRGGLEGKPCYHVAAMFDLHRQLAGASDKPLKAVDMSNAPYLKTASGNPERIGRMRI